MTHAGFQDHRWTKSANKELMDGIKSCFSNFYPHIPSTTIVSESIGQTFHRAGFVPELLT